MCEHFNDSKYFKTSLSGKQIFKDECTLCFASSKTESGIDLCLSCFNGSCNSYKEENKFNHTDLHSDSFQHFIYLNIKKHVKLIKSGSENITKLAIGVEGGVGIDLEEVTFSYFLICKHCDVAISDIPQNYNFLIKSIEEHKNAYESIQLASWELEMRSCQHSRNLHEKAISSTVVPDLTKCGNCELSSNLWLCLECGNLGCGRKNFDGTGGNNHGIDHFNATNHSIAVKSGTISSSEEPSAYCYTCNDDISVPLIGTVLKKFGIDRSKMAKTEKTINEMSLEYNLNLKLSKTFEQNQHLIEIQPGSRSNGLINIGNSCYINVILQCLSATNIFSNIFGFQNDVIIFHILSNHSESSISYSNCNICQTAKLATWLPSNENLEIRPYMFRHLIGKGHIEFQTKNQQDCSEYLIHLFKKLSEIEKILGSSFTALFEYHSVNKLSCSHCNSVFIRNSKGLVLDILLPQTFLNSFSKNSEEEIKLQISELLKTGLKLQNETLFCNKCALKTLFESEIFLSHFPDYLILKLQNFYIDNFTAKKLNLRYIFNPDHFSCSGIDWTNESGKIDQSSIMKQDKNSQVNEEFLNQLLGMGFSKAKCLKALTESNNQLENAMNLLFSMDSEPEPELEFQGKAVCSNLSYLFDRVWVIVNDFGTDKKYVQKVCDHFHDKEIDFIVNYLMDHSQDDGSIPEKQEEDFKQHQEIPENIKFSHKPGSTYEIFGSVVHLGKSTNVGHYVAYVRGKLNDKNTWLYFNDESVYQCETPELGKSYLLFLRKI